MSAKKSTMAFMSLTKSKNTTENVFTHKEFLERDVTNYLKGGALIFMFFHHF